MAISAKEYNEFVLSKKGVPYIYGCKGHDGTVRQERINRLAKAYPNVFTEKYLKKVVALSVVGTGVACDCSGLVCWPLDKSIEYGSAQLYQKAYARLPISKIDDFASGTVLWRNGHVGVYIGKDDSNNYICAEEKGIDYGCIVGATRPDKWSYGLTLPWVEYDITNPIPSVQITYKGKNPYPVPTEIIKNGTRGKAARWLQWELIEAGYGNGFVYEGVVYKAVSIDGEVGPITIAALKSFQRSCKIEVDGECGEVTRKYLVDTDAPVIGDRCPYQAPTKYLRIGARGQGVMFVQWHLAAVGYTIDIDGQYGTETAKIVKDFQKEHKLEVDGVIGNETLSMLIAMAN